MAKKTEKNKGPKGKKARAKAKLDRQWGEAADENENKLRKGKSRILSRKKVERALKPTPPQFEEDEEPVVDSAKEHYDSNSDRSDDDEDDDLVVGAYSKLLNTIQQRKGSDPDTNSGSESDDHRMEEVSHLEDDESDDDSSLDGENETSMEDFDPFGKRFSETAPLPEDEDVIGRLSNTEKVAVPHVDPLLELQISKSLFQEVGLKTDANKTYWKTLARSSFGCNRDLLKKRWQETKSRKRLLSPLQTTLYPFLSRYADCLMHGQQSSREQTKEAVLLHMLNHVLTSRGRIQRHNRRIKSITEESEADGGELQNHNEEETWKDQGFTRPTILVLLPTRGECYTFITQIIELLDGHSPQEFLDRFEAEYGPPPEDDDETDEAKRRRRKKVLDEKGKAWQDLFGDQVNDDDDFKIGIALTSAFRGGLDGGKKKAKKDTSSGNGTNVKLYTDFYSSDIIVASPLGLKMTMTSEKGEGDADFLSSIEICLVDRADVLLFQNWDHVNDVLDRLNQLPKNNNETDFSRVRNYFLVDQAANWRQLIFSSEFLDPMILSSFKRFARSHSGMVKMRRRISEDEGSIANVIIPMRQVFQRIPTTSFTSQSDDRIKYMTEKILPPILQNKQKHTLIFIPSYFDFVVLRNHLIKREAEFVTVNEYSRVSETSRGRARFLQGRKQIMLYTGRAHFFLRHKIKGIRHLVLFGLPEYPEFYADLVNVINEGLENDRGDINSDSTTSSLALFTKYEAHALERIVGTKQSNRMIKGEKSSFMFVS